MRAIPATLVLLLLLVPGAQAATPNLEGTVGTIQADGDMLAQGMLRYVEVADCDGASLQGTGRTEGRVEQSEETYLAAAGVGTPTETELDFPAQTGRLAIVPDVDCRILIQAAGRGAQVTFGGTQVLPDAPTLNQPRKAWASSPAILLDGTNALTVEARTPVQLLGDVEVVVWASTISIQGSEDLWTGYREQPSAPGVPTGRATYREAVFRVYDANLTLQGAKGVALNQAELDLLTGRLNLADARLVQVEGNPTVALAAPAQLHVAPDGRRLLAKEIQAERLEVDGQTIVFPAPGGGPSWAWWVLLAVPLAVAEFLRRDWGVRRLMAAKNFAPVPGVSRGIAWIPLLGRQARLARAVALLQTKQFDRAREVLTPARPWRRMEPTWHYLWAHLSAATGEKEAAAESLADCLALTPAYLADAQSDPVLRPIVEQALRQAEARRASPVEGYS